MFTRKGYIVATCDVIMQRIANTWPTPDRIWLGRRVSSQCLLLEPTSAGSKSCRDRASMVLRAQWRGFDTQLCPNQCVRPLEETLHRRPPQAPTRTTSMEPSSCSRAHLPRQALTCHRCVLKPQHGPLRSPASASPLRRQTAGRFLPACFPTTCSHRSKAVRTPSLDFNIQLGDLRCPLAASAHRAVPV